jgi:hypothetical protein
MKKVLAAVIAVFILGTLFITAIVSQDNEKQTTTADFSLKEEVVTEKEKMIEVFALVNKAIPHINDIEKGTITSEYSGYFMLAGKVVKDETTVEKTSKGISYKTTETYYDGATKLYEAVVDEPISEIVYIQWYPKEEIKKEYFDKAEKLTINRNEEGTEFRIDWKQDEIKVSTPMYMTYLYSHITVDKNGYITDWSFYAETYEKDAEGNKVNATDSTVTVKLLGYSE